MKLEVGAGKYVSLLKQISIVKNLNLIVTIQLNLSAVGLSGSRMRKTATFTELVSKTNTLLKSGWCAGSGSCIKVVLLKSS